MGYHDASVLTPDVARVSIDDRGFWKIEYDGTYPEGDPRWPVHCACGYAFSPSDERQVFTDIIYRRIDNGEELSRRKLPPGALWFAQWLENDRHWLGPDGHVLMCQTPGGEWNIDGRASNCDMRDDNAHRCWVRHGDPRDPLGLKSGKPLHVDKNGLTCNAGAGSIQAGSYHGFLHRGKLTQS